MNISLLGAQTTWRVFAAVDEKYACEIAEHRDSHYVQGCNEYIATQSSDRSVHVYRISERRSVFRRKKWVSKKEYRLYYCRVQYITTF